MCEIGPKAHSRYKKKSNGNGESTNEYHDYLSEFRESATTSIPLTPLKELVLDDDLALVREKKYYCDGDKGSLDNSGYITFRSNIPAAARKTDTVRFPRKLLHHRSSAGNTGDYPEELRNPFVLYDVPKHDNRAIRIPVNSETAETKRRGLASRDLNYKNNLLSFDGGSQAKDGTFAVAIVPGSDAPDDMRPQTVLTNCKSEVSRGPSEKAFASGATKVRYLADFRTHGDECALDGVVIDMVKDKAPFSFEGPKELTKFPPEQLEPLKRHLEEHIGKTDCGLASEDIDCYKRSQGQGLGGETYERFEVKLVYPSFHTFLFAF